MDPWDRMLYLQHIKQLNSDTKSFNINKRNIKLEFLFKNFNQNEYPAGVFVLIFATYEVHGKFSPRFDISILGNSCCSCQKVLEAINVTS